MEEKIEKFLKIKERNLIDLVNKHKKGMSVVGTYCTYAPTEVIYAAGAIPVSLCSMDDSCISVAEKDLPANICPLIKASYGYAKTDKCPYFHFSDLIIGETTCDGKKKMYELLNDIKETYVMQLPYNRALEESYTFWKKSLERLIEKLNDFYDIKITDEKLIKAIKIKNKKRIAVKEVYELMKLKPAILTGKSLYQVINATKYIFDDFEVIDLLNEFKNYVKKNPNNNTDKRILLTGCPMGKATEKIVDLVEKNGGNIVFFENCTISKEKHHIVDESIDPISALTKHYLEIPCSVMSPNKLRKDRIEEILKDYKIDGVIDMTLFACHTYNIESHSISNLVEVKNDTPYLKIETDFSDTDTGQLNTRMGAFLEML